MLFAIANLLIVATLFVAMSVFYEWGRRIGERDGRSIPEENKGGTGPTEAVVFGLLGLFIAFTFSGAALRFEHRRDQIVEEANAIGTAWQRIDVLPAAAQAPVRDLIRRYVDSRLERYRLPPLSPDVQRAIEASVALQGEIWSTAVASAKESREIPPSAVLLPALNAMFDIATTREAARLVHPPIPVYATIGVLALVSSLFAGYGTAGKSRSAIHRWGLAAVLSLALYVIIDLEFPRVGFIRLDAADSVMRDVRASMD